MRWWLLFFQKSNLIALTCASGGVSSGACQATSRWGVSPCFDNPLSKHWMELWLGLEEVVNPPPSWDSMPSHPRVGSQDSQPAASLPAWWQEILWAWLDSNLILRKSMRFLQRFMAMMGHHFTLLSISQVIPLCFTSDSGKRPNDCNINPIAQEQLQRDFFSLWNERTKIYFRGPPVFGSDEVVASSDFRRASSWFKAIFFSWILGFIWRRLDCQFALR